MPRAFKVRLMCWRSSGGSPNDCQRCFSGRNEAGEVFGVSDSNNSLPTINVAGGVDSLAELGATQ